VHCAVERRLWRRREGHRADARHLRRHDAHDHARRVHRLATGHVEADPVDRLPALDHLGSRPERGHRPLRHLRLRGRTDPFDRGLECRTHIGGQREHGLRQFFGVDAHARGPHPVEPLGLVEQGDLAAGANVVDQLAGGVGGRGAVRLRARHDRGESGSVEGLAAEVDDREHGPPSLSTAQASPRA
jgi:hypothetical protein